MDFDKHLNNRLLTYVVVMWSQNAHVVADIENNEEWDHASGTSILREITCFATQQKQDWTSTSASEFPRNKKLQEVTESVN